MVQLVHEASYYTGKRYPLYFQTKWWALLNDQLIDSNPKAKCWICHKKYSLLLHHEKYTLFREKLYRDIFILCFTCHDQLHFPTLFFMFRYKVPLRVSSLRRRRLWLKLMFHVRSKRFTLVPWYLLRYSIAQ